MITEDVTWSNVVRNGFLSDPFTDGAGSPKYHHLHIMVVGEEEGNFSAIVLNLPGAGSCGDTEKEAIENAKDAVREVIASHVDAGEDVPWGEDPSAEVSKDAKLLWVVLDA
jgi:predicted RNase H-like HicB family nuclease